MLADLNTRPRTTYVAEVFNLNQEFEQARVEHQPEPAKRRQMGKAQVISAAGGAAALSRQHQWAEARMATKDVKVKDPMLDPLTGEVRVLAPGHTFRSVTEKISRIVLTPHTPLGWFGGFLLASAWPPC